MGRLGYAAVSGGDEKCVETLAALETFDGWNVPDNDGDTPVMMALKGGCEYLVEILLGCPRVDLNVPDSVGDTPIMCALKRSKTELVEILLGCPRVDLSCRDEKGWSLVFRAIQRNELGEIISNFSAQNIYNDLYL